MQNIDAITVDHAGFTVASLDDAVRFWTNAMGFELLRQAELTGVFIVQAMGVDAPAMKAAVVKAPDGFRIELIEYAAEKDQGCAPGSVGAVGAAHVAITVANIQHAVARIEAEGWTAKGSIQSIPTGARQGTKIAYISGPDGIVIELLQVPA